MQMRFIGAADQEKLRARFQQDLSGDVRLQLFVKPATGLYLPGREEPQTGRQAQQLMQELVALSEKLHLEVHNPQTAPEIAERYRIHQTPALVLEPLNTVLPASAEHNGPTEAEAPDQSGHVRFFGVPSGYEFATLIEDIVDVSSRKTRLSEATREALAAVTTPLHLQVFVTPT